MENQKAVEQIAISCGVSMDEAASAIQIFCQVFETLRDGIKSLYELAKARIEEIKQEIEELNGTGKSMTLYDFICLMNEAHRLAIEEDKKPPDSRPAIKQADSAGMVGDPVSP